MRNDASPRLSDTKMNSPCSVFDQKKLPSAQKTNVNKCDVLNSHLCEAVGTGVQDTVELCKHG